jgi:hypothetical protein
MKFSIGVAMSGSETSAREAVAKADVDLYADKRSRKRASVPRAQRAEVSAGSGAVNVATANSAAGREKRLWWRNIECLPPATTT